MRGPSAKAIHAHLGRWLTQPQARQLKRAMSGAETQDEVDAVLDLANVLLSAHGVEAIRADAQVDRYYYDIVALYVNMGDPYVPTVLYDTEREKFEAASWGDWLEAQQRSRRYRFE